MVSRRHAIKSGIGAVVVAAGGFQHSGVAQESTPDANTIVGLDSLFHANITDLPKADDGQIQVVLVGQGGSRSVGVVIHNASDQELGIDDISGIARDTGGTLHAVSDNSILAPYVLEPGQYGIGLVSFDKDILIDNEISFEVKTETPNSGFIPTVDLAVTEVSLSENKAIGIVENDTDMAASALTAVVGIFFTSDGQICGWVRTFLNDGVAPGGIGTFNTSSVDGMVSDSYMFAASGWAES